METKAELARALYWTGEKDKANLRVKKIKQAAIKRRDPQILLILENIEQFFFGHIWVEFLEALANEAERIEEPRLKLEFIGVVIRNLLRDGHSAERKKGVVKKLIPIISSLLTGESTQLVR